MEFDRYIKKLLFLTFALLFLNAFVFSSFIHIDKDSSENISNHTHIEKQCCHYDKKPLNQENNCEHCFNSALNLKATPIANQIYCNKFKQIHSHFYFTIKKILKIDYILRLYQRFFIDTSPHLTLVNIFKLII